MLLLLAGCGAEAPDAPGGARPAGQAKPGGEAPPIDPEVVQADVEQDEKFQRLLEAYVPRRLPDRHEERDRYPMFDFLQALDYATISDDTSRGMYEKVLELTDAGRRDLGDYLDEDDDRYIITVAEREYLPGSERYSSPPGDDDRVSVNFRWQWSPVNPLGERLKSSQPMWVPERNSRERQGHAFYVRTADGWELDRVSMENESPSYM